MKPALSKTLLACLALTCLVTPALAQTTTAPDVQVDLASHDETRLAVPAGLTLRARITAITPAEPTLIEWRFGGEGLGGNVTRGAFPHPSPDSSTTPKPLDLNQWSDSVPLASIVGKGPAPRKFFLTLKAGRPGKPRSPSDRTLEGYSTNVTVELEFSLDGKVIKTLTEKSLNGPTFGIVIPFERLTPGKTAASPEFTDNLTGLLGYVQKRAALLEALSWAKDPLPRRFAFMTDLTGYAEGVGFAVRHNDPQIIDTEALTLRQIGVNGLRAAPSFLFDRVKKNDPDAQALLMGVFNGPLGFPVPRFVKERPATAAEAGCPYAPGVPARTQELIARALTGLNLPVKEVWTLTVDEIGAVVDTSPEGKPHLATCDHCAEGYRNLLKSKNVTPQDLGKSDWSQVRPINIWSKDPAAPPLDYANPQIALGAYYSKIFINTSTAKLYTSLRETIAKTNKAKQDAIAQGKLDSPEARQPWLYSYALRGNTFLLGGHSLDFFDFYRLADNAFVYETSNRDPRVWQWDSYLCDVGRYIAGEQNLAQGLYVKPHRGAPIQRALTGIARGCTSIFWYTYGPDYAKGDSFSERPGDLLLCSKAAHMIAKAEDALYGAKWAQPAKIAIVKPFSSEIWMSLTKDPVWTAAFENAKWTHTGLTHAHLPVDAIDETALAAIDLSKYEVICYMGPNITRTAADKLSQWVKAGGSLYTSGYGLSRDEANQPLDSMLPVLGLTKRQPPSMWRSIPTYGAGTLSGFTDPKGQLSPLPADASITGSGAFSDTPLKPVVGREVLHPAPDTKVLARHNDQTPAATVNKYGKGEAWVVGFFPGLEYAATVHEGPWDMSRDYAPSTLSYIAGPALCHIAPPIVTASPTVEAVHLRHPLSGAQTLVLMNWAYRALGDKNKKTENTPAAANVPLTDLKITFTIPITAKEAHSAALDKSFPITHTNRESTLTLPTLQEGDILTLR